MTIFDRRQDPLRALKTAWFGLIALLLGPFALGLLLDGKLRRRGLASGGRYRLPLNLLLFAGFYLLLFLAPLHWSILLGLYLAAGAASAWALAWSERAVLFNLGPAPDPNGSPSFAESLVAVGLAVLPMVYVLALVHNIGELGSFSIRLPSDVYTEALRWVVLAVPGVLAGAWAARVSGWRPGIRVLLFLYAGLAVVLVWFMVWERVDQALLALEGIEEQEPQFFSYQAEILWRAWVKYFFHGGGFVLGVAYLAGAARTSVFAKRAMLLGGPSLLLYVNMLFALGDWHRHLGALGDAAYARSHLGTYRLLAWSQLARTPSAYRSPFLREEWMELEYQSGDTVRARALLERLVRDGQEHPWHAPIGRRAERSLAALASPHGAPVTLDLPVIRPASYLNRDWYALLGAVAFLKPEWNDIELRKRLLDLSTTVQLNLPRLETLPDLAPAFRQLGIPFSPCFLTKDRAVDALRRGDVPFLSLYGQWVPLSGYDSGRDGFWYHSYSDPPRGTGLFRNEDVDLFHHRPGESFGGQRELDRERRLSLQKFITAEEFERHVLDIGGVAVILGDSAFVDAKERRAAFLVEQGDAQYQDLDNFEEAAACYREAARLHTHDQILSRIAFLKRRYRETASDPSDYRNLFRDYPPAWMRDLGPEGEAENALVGRILAGKLGTYLLLNWHVPPPPDTSARARAALDTAIGIFTTLHAMDPAEPLYLDSLADLKRRAGDLEESGRLLESLLGLYPFGNEYAEYRLAWVMFKLGRMEEVKEALMRCPGFATDARHLTMQGAVAMAEGRHRRAYDALSRSLKLDKGLGETHALLAEYHKLRGEPDAETLHRLWLKRST